MILERMGQKMRQNKGSCNSQIYSENQTTSTVKVGKGHMNKYHSN